MPVIQEVLGIEELAHHEGSIVLRLVCGHRYLVGCEGTLPKRVKCAPCNRIRRDVERVSKRSIEGEIFEAPAPLDGVEALP